MYTTNFLRINIEINYNTLASFKKFYNLKKFLYITKYKKICFMKKNIFCVYKEYRSAYFTNLILEY